MQKAFKALSAIALTAGLGATANAAQTSVDLLVYQVWEQGVDPYISRILVSDSMVRLDEGQGSSQYSLYDRKAGVLYNIDDEERSILEIAPGVRTVPAPKDFRMSESIEVDADAPRIGGQQARRVTLRAGDEVCRELVAVPDLMTNSLAAMRELQTTLGYVQAATLNAMPMDTQTACDLAENVYAPLRRLDHGLPIQEDEQGRGRALLDFSTEFAIDERLLSLPLDYRKTSMGALSPGE